MLLQLNKFVNINYKHIGKIAPIQNQTMVINKYKLYSSFQENPYLKREIFNSCAKKYIRDHKDDQDTSEDLKTNM